MILGETELVSECIAGKKHAQALLFDKYYEECYVIAMRYLSVHQDAQDVVVKAFTRIFNNLSKFEPRGDGSLGRWIRTILINEALRLLRKRKITYDLDDSDNYLEIKSSAADAVQQMSAEDISQLVEKLPAGYRTVFNLFAVEGYSHAEIAEMLGITVSTSKTQLKKARHHLMSQLNKEEAYGTI